MKNYFSGFTLIELMIAVTIIGILAGVVVAIINPEGLRGRARDGVRKNDIAVIKGAIELFYAENNAYPGSVPFGGSWIDGGVTYLNSVPQDPKAGQSYCYGGGGSLYILCARVEDENQAANGAGNCFGVAANEAYCVMNPF